MSSEPISLSRRRAVALLLGGLLHAGCGYSVRPPFSSNIRTVYVPVFKSVSFRRDLNLTLTRMVQEEIKARTPFKVVGTPEGADSTLDGTITFTDKNLMVENPNNLPRQIMGSMVATVKWTDNRISKEKKLTTAAVPVVETAPYYIELGETTQLGYIKAMERLSRQIVDMMEEPW